jgi:hypothetical protein
MGRCQGALLRGRGDSWHIFNRGRQRVAQRSKSVGAVIVVLGLEPPCRCSVELSDQRLMRACRGEFAEGLKVAPEAIFW